MGKNGGRNLPKETEEVLLAGGYKYLLTYDPIHDRGTLNLVNSDDERTELLHYRLVARSSKRLYQLSAGHYALKVNERAYGFFMPDGKSDAIFAPLSPETPPEFQPKFRALMSQGGKMEWGVLDDNIPSIRLASGDILVLTGAPSTTVLKVEDHLLIWRLKSDDAKTNKIKTYALNLNTGHLTINDGSAKRTEWVAYTTKPGDSISQYLLDHGIIERVNLFRRLFGQNQNELKHWVDKIAKKNDISWGGKGDYDFQLKDGYRLHDARKGDGYRPGSFVWR